MFTFFIFYYCSVMGHIHNRSIINCKLHSQLQHERKNFTNAGNFKQYLQLQNVNSVLANIHNCNVKEKYSQLQHVE